MNDIRLFGFEGKDVRVIDKNGDPWFVATDACRTWGLGNASQTIKRLDDDERDLIIIETPGGPQKVLIISESGLHAITSVSRMPAAKRFWKHVRSVILPSIRKTGRYDNRDNHSDHPEDGELVRYAREVERQRREMDLIRDTQIRMQGETIQALKIALEANKTALEAKDASQTAIRDAKHAEEFCAWAPYASSKGIYRTTQQASQDGKRLTAMCKARGIEPGIVTNERWGQCKSYPRFIMDEYIAICFSHHNNSTSAPIGST